MTPEIRQEYLKALGMPEFLYIESKGDSAALTLTKCLVVEDADGASFTKSGQSYDLLEKMLGAIGLSMSDVKCVRASEHTLSSVIKNNPAATILIMGEVLSSSLDHVFTTFHPHEILKNPALKRKAWEVLKEIKNCLE